MYYGSTGERTAQLKREVTVPNKRVAVVKFIVRPPKLHNYISIMYHSDTKVCINRNKNLKQLLRFKDNPSFGGALGRFFPE